MRKYIPDAITSMNLLCGILGVILTLKGSPAPAFILMLAAAVFDFFDGFAARMLKASSGLGKELDSLADMVSFGVLPSVMLFETMFSSSRSLVCFVPLFLAIMSAFRLAKFNVDERQHSSFIGLPTPAAAMICGSLAYFVATHPGSLLESWCHGPVFIPVLSVILAILLVAEIPMFSMKFGTGEDGYGQKIRRIAFFCIIACIAITITVMRLNWSLAILITFIVYILMNLAFAVFPATRENGKA